MKFIKLTEANEKRCQLLLNAANISCIQAGLHKDTYIKMVSPTYDKVGLTKTDYYFVTETIEQIQLMLSIDNSKVPVIMTADEALVYYSKGGK